jgi:heptosyltransferase-1
MGDVIHTLPAATDLRGAFPEAQIGWIVEQRWAELLVAKNTALSGLRSPSRPLLDFVHVVNTKSWRKSPFSAHTRRELSAALKEIRGQKYDLAIDFQGAIKSAFLASLAAAGTVFGMQKPRETPARMFYAQSVPTTGTHVVEKYQSLTAAIVKQFAAVHDKSRATLARGNDRRVLPEPGGLANPWKAAGRFPKEIVEFPRDPAADREVANKLQDVAGDVVLVNPGAGWAAKEWPPERFGRVAQALAAQGLTSVINYGPGEEELARSVEASSSGSARPVSCSVGELIALTRRSRLFIGGDTGPLHLAAALGVPAVAIFGPTDPARNGPYLSKSIVLRHEASRTSLSHTSNPDPGLLQITPEQVISAARRLLEDAGA